MIYQKQSNTLIALSIKSKHYDTLVIVKRGYGVTRLNETFMSSMAVVTLVKGAI